MKDVLLFYKWMFSKTFYMQNVIWNYAENIFLF